MNGPESEISVQKDNLGPEGLSGAIPEVSSAEPHAGSGECQDSSGDTLELLDRDLCVHGSHGPNETFTEFMARIAADGAKRVREAEEARKACESRSGQTNSQ